MGDVHDVGATGHRGQRQAAGQSLGGGDQVRDQSFMLTGEPRSGAGDPGLDLVGNQQDAAIAAVGDSP